MGQPIIAWEPSGQGFQPASGVELKGRPKTYQGLCSGIFVQYLAGPKLVPEVAVDIAKLVLRSRSATVKMRLSAIGVANPGVG